MPILFTAQQQSSLDILLQNPLSFTWPQLVTALLGGAVALPVAAMLRRALKKQGGVG